MQTNKYPQDLVLEGYGVKLKRLTHDKIELLRQWRNDPKIQQYMFYRETITPEMQEKWFQKINNDCNFYFIIEYNGKEIGCIDIKDVDYDEKIGEYGIFIYDNQFLNSDAAVRALFCITDFIWNDLHLEAILIHVLINNSRAIRFNEIQGYKMLPGEEGKENRAYILTKEDAHKPNKKMDLLRIMLK